MNEAIKTVRDIYLEKMLDASIEAIESIYNELKEDNLLNDQRTLDWLDKLNEISVRH